KPVRILKTVVLPAPFGPINPTSSPGLSSRLKPETARSPPKEIEMSSTLSRATVTTPFFRPGRHLFPRPASKERLENRQIHFRPAKKALRPEDHQDHQGPGVNHHPVSLEETQY